MLRTIRRWRRLGVCLVLVLAPVLAPAAWAGQAVSPQPSLLLYAELGLSVQQAVELVRRQYKGQVVKATETEFQGRPAYRIRLVNAGRVRDVLVDAQSGQIINARGNDG